MGMRGPEPACRDPVPTTAPPWRRRLLVGAAVAIGVVWRAIYILWVHPAAAYADGEAAAHLALARRLAAGEPLTAADALVAPGLSWLLAGLLAVAPGGALVGPVQLVLSGSVPLLLAAIGRELFSPQIACGALVLGALYFPFIDYASFYLPENPCLVLILLSTWVLVRGVRAPGPRGRGLAGCAAGALWGLAAAFCPRVLLPGVCMLGVLATASGTMASAAAVGLAVVAAGLTTWFTAVSGRWCLVDARLPLAVVLGHHGPGRAFEFAAPAGGRPYAVTLAPVGWNGGVGPVRIPHGPLDGAALLHSAAAWIGGHPVDALLLSVRQVFALFIASPLWPGGTTAFGRWLTLAEELYWLLVLAPAALHVRSHRRQLCRAGRDAWADLVALAPLGGLALGAFLTAGEARGRIPLDGFVILLAARWYGGRAETEPRASVGAAGAWHAARGSVPALLVVCMAGAVWRAVHVGWLHPPARFLWSDMLTYVTLAERREQGIAAGVFDAMHPPGLPALLAVLHRLDPSWQMLSVTQSALSALVPVLLAAIGWQLHGPRVALMAATLAAVYFPFVDHAGYCLTENPCLAALLASTLCLACGLRAGRLAGTVGFSAASGVLLGCAAAFRSVALSTAALWLLCLVCLAWRRRERRLLVAACAMTLGTLVVLVPLGMRCTRANEGRICAIDSRGPVEMLMGHFGHATYFEFVARGATYAFGSPTAIIQRGLDRVTLPFAPDDLRAVLATLRDRVCAHPIDAALMSVRNVFNLFVESDLWPALETDLHRWSVLSVELYWVLVLLPAWGYVVGLRRRPVAWEDVLLVAPLAGLAVTVFFTLGEPRYRIPFDGFVILLAARACTLTEPAAPARPARRGGSPSRPGSS